MVEPISSARRAANASAGEGMSVGRRPRITNGYVFRSLFQDEPERCRKLLEVSLGIDVAEVRFVEDERVIEADDGNRAGRLDLYVVDAAGNRYDVEVQAKKRGDELLRARHYQALMDVSYLRRGGRVADLPNSVVLFICDFDPLGDKRRRYECVTMEKKTKRVVEDRRLTVILNAKGTEGDVSPALKLFLRLVSGEDVSGDPFVDELNAIMDRYIADKEWMEGYMTFEDELETERMYGERIGRIEMAAEMVRDGIVSVAEAARRAGATEERIERAVADLRVREAQ